MKIQSIEDVFIHLLSDTYSAEKQLTRALAKLAREASCDELKTAFSQHLDETHGHVERIDKLLEENSNIKVKRIKCMAMEGLIEEAKEVIESTDKNEVRDVALIAAAQKWSIMKLLPTARCVRWQNSWDITPPENCLPQPWRRKKRPI
ncbi:Domain of uncharacterised function (DUF892) [Raoultella terrigena]|uniref:Domain of uncharacterized function (DUF892) n=1 Tax=Raoultella terrigena TaxID=577 RepID=A0A485BWV2_RAOTE|nr:Domain of uncharacterised function (DUF892) [Raoultella terrigena]